MTIADDQIRPRSEAYHRKLSNNSVRGTYNEAQTDKHLRIFVSHQCRKLYLVYYKKNKNWEDTL